jgi:hypothetical protein
LAIASTNIEFTQASKQNLKDMLQELEEYKDKLKS